MSNVFGIFVGNILTMNNINPRSIEIIKGELTDIKGQLDRITDLYESVLRNTNNPDKEVKHLLEDIESGNSDILVKLEDIESKLPNFRH